MSTETQICAERQDLLDKVSAAVRAHSEATAQLAQALIAQREQKVCIHLRVQTKELEALVKVTWEEYHGHVAQHNCR